MSHLLFDKLALPDACHLGKRVFKKLFYENAWLGVTDKKAFTEDIDAITWQYSLKPTITTIRPYEDEQREYHEIAILQVDLSKRERVERLAEIMHRAIPYPLIVVFSHENSCAISVAHKRFSQAEKGAVVAEDITVSEWIDFLSPTPAQGQFLGGLAFDRLPRKHFLAFYSAVVDRLLALDCAVLSGHFRLESSPEEIAKQRNALAASRELRDRIAVCRSALKKESQFNRQVELNVQIKELEKELAAKVAEL